MINLVNSVADLTALRDREELEIVMAMAASDLLDASEGKLWRLAHHSGQMRLHERAMLADRCVTISDMPRDKRCLPTLASQPQLNESYKKQISLPVGPDEDGRHRHVFPILNSQGVDGFLDVCCAAPLNDDQRRLASGLLRIYQNHLKNLDYSESDELTGLLNRKTFDGSFKSLKRIPSSGRLGAVQYERIERRRQVDPSEPRWLAVMDIDLFKRINDGFGHLCGDEILVAVAQLMRRSFRQADRLFRYGGEEFLVILEPTEARHVKGVLDRFRAVVERHNFPQVGDVTMSVGYTSVSADDTGLTAFQRADEALYFAKRHGRNQVICFEEAAEGGAKKSAGGGVPVEKLIGQSWFKLGGRPRIRSAASREQGNRAPR